MKVSKDSSFGISVTKALITYYLIINIQQKSGNICFIFVRDALLCTLQ
jgi:hypothetical protein